MSLWHSAHTSDFKQEVVGSNTIFTTNSVEFLRNFIRKNSNELVKRRWLVYDLRVKMMINVQQRKVKYLQCNWNLQPLGCYSSSQLIRHCWEASSRLLLELELDCLPDIVTENILVHKMLLPKTFSATSKLLPSTFSATSKLLPSTFVATNKFNLLLRKYSATTCLLLRKF